MTLRKHLPETPEMPAFEIRSSSIQGLGGFATRPIRRGERIGEYVGERVSHREADRRYDDDVMGRHHTFLFTVSSRVVIDAAVGGNDTRFINHSCAPNCEAVIEDGRVFIEARRPIPQSGELFYDYAYERDPVADAETDAQYPCRCGAPNCRGTILAPAPRRRRPKPRRSKSRTSKPTRRGDASAAASPKRRGAGRTSRRPLRTITRPKT
jgi:SET domain-containing protein